MGMVWILLPASLFLAALFVGAFRWAVNSGQFDDPDREALRVLFHESDPAVANRRDADRSASDGSATPEENNLHVQ